MSGLEKIFIERNNLPKVSSAREATSNSTFSTPKKKKKGNGKKSGNRIVNPNSSDYSSQLLKANLRKKFDGYEYGLSDW